MKFRLFILIIVVITSSARAIHAQELSLIGRTNLSIGLDYRVLDYFGEDLLYSPGGGMGLELGLQVDMGEGFALQSTLGYQLNLAFQIESFDGVTNKSSSSFNRKFVSLGALKGFNLNGTTIKSLQFGSGINFNWPGALSRIENDVELGKSTYSTGIGLYFEAGLRLQILDNTYLDPAIRYRKLSFTAKSFTQGAVSELPDYLQKLNANGIELGVTFVRKIGR